MSRPCVIDRIGHFPTRRAAVCQKLEASDVDPRSTPLQPCAAITARSNVRPQCCSAREAFSLPATSSSYQHPIYYFMERDGLGNIPVGNSRGFIQIRFHIVIGKHFPNPQFRPGMLYTIKESCNHGYRMKVIPSLIVSQYIISQLFCDHICRMVSSGSKKLHHINYKRLPADALAAAGEILTHRQSSRIGLRKLCPLYPRLR